MSKMSAEREYLYSINYTSTADPFGVPGTHQVRASYFIEDGQFTSFKDGNHQVVLAVKTDMVQVIVRGELA